MVPRTWSIRDARNRFSEIVRAARRAPQTITRHGRPAVVIIAASEYDRFRKLERLNAPSFAEMLLGMPQGDVEFERLESRMREPEF